MKSKNVKHISQEMTSNININGGKIYLFNKRLFDIVSSSLFLLLFGWLILILLAIKWAEDAFAKGYKLDIKPATNKTKTKYKQYSKDGTCYEVKIVPNNEKIKDKTVYGPIYSSTRVGKDGKIFKFYKIRTMCKGAEEMKEQLLAYGINEADGPAFKLKYDPRISRFGKFLRKTSLDELPQIWNILKGDISVIGPRSPLIQEVEEYNDFQKHRLDVKGGLVCTWQISKKSSSIIFR